MLNTLLSSTLTTKTWNISKDHKFLNQRQARWSMNLLLFDFEIKYIQGSSNTIPDSLSRHPDYQYSSKEPSDQPIIPDSSFTNLCSLIQHPFDERICKDTRTSEKYHSFIQKELSEDWTFAEDFLLFIKRFWVCDVSMCKEIISCYHDTLAGGHHGTCKTAHHIKTRYIW